jgi:hypothetical protein
MRPEVDELSDPGPCDRKWNMHVWGEGGGLPLGSAPQGFCLSRSGDAEGIEATRRRAASHILNALLPTEYKGKKEMQSSEHLPQSLDRFTTPSASASYDLEKECRFGGAA